MRAHSVLRVLMLALQLAALSVTATALHAQEIPSIKADDLKKSPQKYWAGFFVFEDTLEEAPEDATICIDDVDYTRFKTRTVGTVYAESGIVETLRRLDAGKPYLFVGTVGQKSGALFGLLGGSKFVVIVRDVSQPKADTINIIGRVPGLELELTTNRVNQTFAQLDVLFKEVQQDMLGFANSQGITIEEVFGGAHRDKVASSVRSALRRYEERNRGNSQEFFVDVIVSMMAVQHGYGEARRESYVPEEITPAEPVVLEQPAAGEHAPVVETYPEVESAEDWDISAVIEEIEKPAAAPEASIPAEQSPAPSDVPAAGSAVSTDSEEPVTAPAEGAGANNPD